MRGQMLETIAIRGRLVGAARRIVTGEVSAHRRLIASVISNSLVSNRRDAVHVRRCGAHRNTEFTQARDLASHAVRRRREESARSEHRGGARRIRRGSGQLVQGQSDGRQRHHYGPVQIARQCIRRAQRRLDQTTGREPRWRSQQWRVERKILARPFGQGRRVCGDCIRRRCSGGVRRGCSSGRILLLLLLQRRVGSFPLVVQSSSARVRRADRCGCCRGCGCMHHRLQLLLHAGQIGGPPLREGSSLRLLILCGWRGVRFLSVLAVGRWRCVGFHAR